MNFSTSTTQSKTTHPSNKRDAKTYKCPNCSGHLTWDPKLNSMRCAHCGYTPDDVSEVHADIPVGKPITQEEHDELIENRQKITGIEEFLNVAPWVEGANAAKSYNCDACGASVMADATVVSTECPYCGNVMLVSGVADATNVPRHIIPFTIDEEKAKQALNEHFQHKWYLPKKFDAYTEHVKSVYVPFHLFDINAKGWANYVGEERETHTDSDGNSHTTTSYWGLYRAGTAQFHHFPVDGSTRMPDTHMDAVGPFKTEKMTDFDAAYVAGHMAEVADEDEQKCLPKAIDLAKKTFEDDLYRDATKGRIDSAHKVGGHTEVEQTGHDLCALPVWLMHCSWLNEQMLFAVNGQTGKCIGNLPIDKTKQILTCIIAFILPAAIGEAIMFATMEENTIEIGKIVGAIIVAIIIATFVNGHFVGQMKTANEASSTRSAYVGGGINIEESANSRRSYMSENAVKRKWFNGQPDKQGSHNH